MDKSARLARIRDSLPKRVFFEKCFLEKGTRLFKKIPISYDGVEHNNVLNCSPLLTRDQEVALFRRLNFLKYLVMKEVVGFKRCKGGPPPCAPREKFTARQIARLERLLDDMRETRNVILMANTRLAIGIIRKHAEKETLADDEFFSETCCFLMKSIDYFDHRRGFKFSTYCVNVLKREVWRFAKNRTRDEFRSNYTDTLEPESDYEFGSEANAGYNRQFLERIFSLVGDSDRGEMRVAILKGMYGIGEDQKVLREIGESFGITKERVRQIKNQSLALVQRVVSEHNLVYDPIF